MSPHTHIFLSPLFSPGSHLLSYFYNFVISSMLYKWNHKPVVKTGVMDSTVHKIQGPEFDPQNTCKNAWCVFLVSPALGDVDM